EEWRGALPRALSRHKRECWSFLGKKRKRLKSIRRSETSQQLQTREGRRGEGRRGEERRGGQGPAGRRHPLGAPVWGGGGVNLLGGGLLFNSCYLFLAIRTCCWLVTGV